MADRSGYWWRMPKVWAGAALSGAAATASFTPSLMPRSTSHQALLAGTSGIVGWAVGSTTYTLTARSGNAALDTAILTAGAAAGLGTRYLIPWHEDEARWRAPVRSIAQVAGAGAASAATVSAVRTSRSRTGVGIAVGAIAAIAAATRISDFVSAQAAARQELDFPTPDAGKALVEGVGVLGVLGALIGGYRISGGSTARLLERRIGIPPTPARVAGNVIATGIWGLGIRALAGSVVKGLARYDRVLDPGYDIPPSSATRSGSPRSIVPWSRLGRQGRRFITNTPSRDDIANVMGVPAVSDPIRVFVGFDAARTAEDRVALAMEELRRTHAFDRRILIASCPAGTGYVNTLPMEVADFATLGDCASVAVQYARLPSLLAIQNTSAGAEHHRLLLQAIKDELDARPPGKRPVVAVYGESLGAWAGQDALIDADIAGLDALGVDYALWVGTPHYSKWRRQALVEGSTPEGSVQEIDGPDELDGFTGMRRATLLTHWNDPVAMMHASLLYREPWWITERPRRPTVSEDQVWIPVVTALQTVVDTFNATNPTPGVFRATGHDYRLDLPPVTVAAFGLPAPTGDQWARMFSHLQAEEKRRDDTLRLGGAAIADAAKDADGSVRGSQG